MPPPALPRPGSAASSEILVPHERRDPPAGSRGGFPAGDAEWADLVGEIRTLKRMGRERHLEMGDRFVEIERRWGKRRIPEAAEQAGVPYHSARQCYWVAKQIPPESPLRRLGLSFTHLRAAAGTREPAKWAERAAQQRWTSQQLVAAIQVAGERNARRKTKAPVCAACEQPLAGAEEIVTLRIGLEKPERCCSLSCAAGYLGALALDELSGAEPVEPGGRSR